MREREREREGGGEEREREREHTINGHTINPYITTHTMLIIILWCSN